MTEPKPSLRTELEALDGVQRAWIDAETGTVHLLCTPDATELPVEVAAQLLLTKHAADGNASELTVSYSAPVARRRVRYLRSELTTPPSGGHASAQVVLEWAGDEYVGEAEGLGGTPGELRVCALATARALESLLRDTVHFTLVGVKLLRIFDRDLVSVLLRADEAPDRDLMGITGSQENLCQATALAVLSATNRLLGNYLATGD